ncbi:MAG: radical SAM protein [Methanosarcinaceae archaeon]|nr:radical SAM protein [Methanosarcinaceae archaeon]
MSDMTEGEAGSFYNYLSQGCKLCQRGAKMVLFVTGICDRSCFYCPLSDERREDAIYANERHVHSDEDVIAEAYQMSALGTGITGGEPLLEKERVLHYIRLLKAEFGMEHHIHLYTSTAASMDTLSQLAKAGLDEIRFHPPYTTWGQLEDTPFARALRDAKTQGMDVGIEIPAIDEARYIGKFVNDMDCFLNLNELEFSDTNANAMHARGFELIDDLSNAVEGSRTCASNITSALRKVHFCSSSYKDAVQLRKRLIKTANNTARVFDEITDDGTLIYGVARSDNIDCLISVLRTLDVPADMYGIEGKTVEMGWWILEDIADEIRDSTHEMSIIERYPFRNGIVVETIPL